MDRNFCYAKIMDSLRKLVNFGKKLSISPFYTFFSKKICWKQKL